MAEENKKADSAGSAAPAASGSKKKVMIVVGALMLLEGVGVFAVMHLMRPAPATASASEEMHTDGHGDEHGDGHGGGSMAATGEFAEIVIGPSDSVNARDGRAYVYHVEVSALVRVSKKDTAKMLVESRGGTIRDRIDTVLRNAEPKVLSEPGLETLRRQLKSELDKISKDEKLVEEILITRFLKTRSNL